MPTPKPIFAPVERPPDNREVLVAGGDPTGVMDTVVLGDEDMVEARASSAESEACHMMGMPSFTTTVLDI